MQAYFITTFLAEYLHLHEILKNQLTKDGLILHLNTLENTIFSKIAKIMRLLSL